LKWGTRDDRLPRHGEIGSEEGGRHSKAQDSGSQSRYDAETTSGCCEGSNDA
jgi:hypothetical protein